MVFQLDIGLTEKQRKKIAGRPTQAPVKMFMVQS